MMPFAAFVGRKPLSTRSGEELPLPVSNFGESIDGDDEGIRGRVEDVVVSESTQFRGDNVSIVEGPRCEGGATVR